MNNADFMQWLSDRLDRIEGTQVEIKADLAEHMRRTDLAEKNIDAVRAEVKPLSAHVAVVSGIFKAFLALGSLSGALYGVIKLLTM